jgi:GWxTD domain-containing protein
MNAHTARLVPALGVALLLAACASTRGLKELDPKSRDFISKVRYTVTTEERKAFLALPADAREAFIADFWKRRDPTPATPENEYKIEYYARLERSTRLFSGGGAPGWLQDRGRVYITLGPPDTRITYPRGVTFYGLPTEIWWYGLYTIVFIDQYWNDDYKLSPDSAAQIAIINQAQREWNLPFERMPKPGDQNYGSAIAGLKVDLQIAKDATAVVALAIPYRNIWLKAAGKTYQANLEVRMKVVDKAGAEAWSFTQAYPIEVTEAGLRDVLGGDFKAQASVPAFAAGAYTLTVVVTNTSDGSKASLERKFQI